MQATQGVPFPEEEADLPMQTTIATRRRKAPLGIVAIFRRKGSEATDEDTQALLVASSTGRGERPLAAERSC